MWVTALFYSKIEKIKKIKKKLKMAFNLHNFIKKETLYGSLW